MLEEESKYDSTADTLSHINRVQHLLLEVCFKLAERGVKHDASKLRSPEKELFDEFTPKLKNTTFGSPEYYQSLKDLEPALKHHYEVNSHHPQHFENGISGMSLMDLIETFADWRASCERHPDGDFKKSISINKERFMISDQLNSIFENTRTELGW